MSTGTIKWFNSNKGYGFIERAGDSDIFVHQNEITGNVNEGDSVTFEVGEGRQGPCAVNVTRA